MGNQKPTISVIIPHVPGKEHDKRLKKCVDSLEGYDELIVVTNQINTLGFTKAVNVGLRLVKGDYLMVVNNDIEWTQGELASLCVPNTVVSPSLNGNPQYFWGCFFVVPRTVLEKVGYLDEQFYLYCSDTDYVMRCRENQVQLGAVQDCNIVSGGGHTTRTIEDREKIDSEDTEKFILKWGQRPDQSI